MVISQMFGALFHDESPTDDISTQFNPLGSLLLSPVPKPERSGTPVSQEYISVVCFKCKGLFVGT